MKKVGIITFHHAKHSYGAFLQAYATLRVVESLGYDAEIINYDNNFEQKEVKLKKKNIKQAFYLIVSWLVRFFVYGGIKDPCRSAKQLDKLYRNVSKRYKNLHSLQSTNYDILVAGSDQIWNPMVCGGIDSAFFLNFGEAETRISYASSIGSYHFSIDELKIIEKYLSRFASISVREQYASDELSSICTQKINVVCDPTLLMTSEQWENEVCTELKSFKKIEPYILTYFVGGNIAQYWDRIKEYVNEIGLSVYNVQSHSRKNMHVNKAIHNILPGDLLAYIKNADYILTDSFHGTVFSILFQKNFVAVINKQNPIRVKNLLERLGLANRIDDKIKGIPKEIDYTKTCELLDEYRKESKDWLEKSLKVD